MSALPKETANESLFSEESSDAISLLRNSNTQEIVIALCGPIGSPLHEVSDAINSKIKNKYKYDSNVIRMSAFIEQHFDKVGGKGIPKYPKAERIRSLIDGGDKLRSTFGASVLAELAVADIRLKRQESGIDRDSVDQIQKKFVGRRVCHIIDSIKNQAELDLLREVYKDLLYVFGVFSPVEARINNMKSSGFQDEKIHELMEKDSKSSGDYGQTVSETFPQSDFFLRMDTNSAASLEVKVERYLDLILSTKIVTPSKEESAMYAAASAASSSACLSRQVGAAVTDNLGEILAVGWNDVPRAFGGLYQTDRNIDAQGLNDHRCYNQGNGKCSNDEEKKLLAETLAGSLGDEILSNVDLDKIVERILNDKKIKGLIEFSRAIHAEMHAIINALKNSGNKVSGGSIFVTTYPCHGCARHIIASGISNVYYIEPYKKSLAVKLHSDAITEVETEDKKVRLLPYEGVAPSRYLSLFKMKADSRKRNGSYIKIAPEIATPKVQKSLQSLPELEGVVFDKLVQRGIYKV